MQVSDFDGPRTRERILSLPFSILGIQDESDVFSRKIYLSLFLLRQKSNFCEKRSIAVFTFFYFHANISVALESRIIIIKGKKKLGDIAS